MPEAQFEIEEVEDEEEEENKKEAEMARVHR